MSKLNQSCLSDQVLEQIGRNEVPTDELAAIEAHVSQCQHCRELFDSHHASSPWSELILPALSETQGLDAASFEDGADHSSAILKLLGPTDDPNMLGRIGNFEIVGVIGQGGMGAVFKGFDRSLNRFVAIKMLLPHLAASGAARKRFAREGQAVAAVVDDHVMAIHCVDEWQGVPYLVMTYSRGVSLQKRLNDNGPLEVREILRIGMQAAKGLAAAHAQGIVHRDIKPSNILLDQNVERVQLVDFGLARAVDDASLTCSGTLAGTPQYMSPEQARAETVDHRSDLFSLGSVLYAMCVGHAPFRAESSYSVLRLITDKEPRPIREVNSEIPQWLCAIIERLMSKSPDERFATANEVATILAHCLAHVQDPTQHALPTFVFDGQSKSQCVQAPRFRRWFPIMSDTRIVSLISLLLLLMALLVPWPIASMGNDELALAFACTATLLSLGLALLSRAEYFSRIVLWGLALTVGCACVGIAVSIPIYWLRYSDLIAMEQAAKNEQIEATKAAGLAGLQQSQDNARPRTGSEPKATKQNDAQPTSAEPGEPDHTADPESGAAKVIFDPEIGIATIKGSRAQVERTKAIVDSILKTRPNAQSDSSEAQKPAGNDSPVAVVMLMHPAELPKGNTIQRAAATKTLGLLADNDYCGVLTYGTVSGKSKTKWLWGEPGEPGLLQVGEHRQAWMDAIAGSSPGDFPDFEPAFQMALDALQAVNAKKKLVIVFTDGDPVFANESFIDKYRETNIKVSVFQVDIHMIKQSSLLKRLVDSTSGTFRYALADQAGAVESFFEREIQKLRADVRPALQKIGLAFHDIHSKTGRFPGSRMVYADKQGKEFEHPFSWRVAILPYIGHQQLYDAYRFDEAWDSENNKALLKKMPDIYRSPYAAADQPVENSNMQGFATAAGGLGLKSGEKLSSFTDGASNTILIVETAQSVPWTKPEDLTEPKAQAMPDQPLRFVMADGSLRELDAHARSTLEKMITRNGGEIIETVEP